MGIDHRLSRRAWISSWSGDPGLLFLGLLLPNFLSSITFSFIMLPLFSSVCSGSSALPLLLLAVGSSLAASLRGLLLRRSSVLLIVLSCFALPTSWA